MSVEKKYGAIIDDQEEKIVNSEEKKEQSESGGRGSPWLVVLASFLCVCVLDGTMYSFGVLVDPMMAELEASRTTISMAGTGPFGDVLGLQASL